MIPVYIICHNNGYYIKQTINQLLNKKILPENIQIVDNNSTGKETLEILKELESSYKIQRFTTNKGPRIWLIPEIWNNVPEYFILTDPDLKYNENLPDNFINKMLEISLKYNAAKVGFALDISKPEEFYKCTYFHDKTIQEWESQFYLKSLPKYEEILLYEADIDTTFFLGCKSSLNNGISIRMASNFTCKHLPFHIKENCSLGYDRLYEMYNNHTKVSTTGSIILSSILSIQKNNINFKVVLDNSHRDTFWKSHYPNWERETFSIFDQYVIPNTVVIDIGSWIGPTVLYCAKKGANIIAVEADKESVQTLQNNVNLNNLENVNIISKAIYSDSKGVYFGENVFRDDGMNASTSQIVTEQSFKQKYFIETITFSDLIRNTDPLNISLIKLDIEGGEENILLEILEYCYKYHIPAYISFHFSWWKEKGRTEFHDKYNSIFELFGHSTNKVIHSPFDSILFHHIKPLDQ